MSDNPNKLQCQLNLCQDYGKMYRITYGASKTVISIVGSKADATFYCDTQPWSMDEQKVSIKEDNEHLGLIVSNIFWKKKRMST